MKNRTPPPAPKGKPSPNRGKTFPPEPLERKDVLAIISACSKRSSSGIRAAALIGVLYRTGARVSEVLAITMEDLHPQDKAIVIRNGKVAPRSKEEIAAGEPKKLRPRMVGMDDEGWRLLQPWLDRRKELRIRSKYVFTTLQGKPVSPSYVRGLLPRMAKRAGLDRRVHPHAFRHTFTTEMVMEGHQLPAIQKQLGHTSIASVLTYIHNVVPESVLAASADRRITRRVSVTDDEKEVLVEYRGLRKGASSIGAFMDKVNRLVSEGAA